MKGKRAIHALSVYIFLFLLTQPFLLGQYGTGTILGTVTDPTGAIISGATVTAKNIATNETRTFTTDAEGFYRFSALPSGIYTVTATSPSFRTAVVSNLELDVNMQARTDITMQVGNISERVEVAGTTP